MIVVFSPGRGFFIGCEPAGFGGVEGGPKWSSMVEEAMDLEKDYEEFDRTAAWHLGYIRGDQPDAVAIQGRTRAELASQAAAYEVHES